MIHNKRKERIEKYREARQKPYIGRMDVVEKGGSRVPIYIGKIGIGDEEGTEEIVIDWRSELGKMFTTYSGGKKHFPDFGDIVGKRQIIIDNLQVKKVIDVGKMESLETGPSGTSSQTSLQLEVTKDEYLEEVLALTSGNYQLVDIIASLQEEQDEIVRLPLNQSVIVQGVAGSGKSSVALHRISYLLFQYEQTLKPEKIIVIAPNKMFISYIQDIDLDIKGINHDTFVDFALKHLTSVKKVKPLHSLLSDYINEEKYDPVREKIARYKNSMSFQKAINRYLDHLEEKYYPKGNLVVNNSFEIPEEKIIEIYNGYKYLPLSQRRERTITSISTIIDDNRIEVEKYVEEAFDHAVKMWVEFLPSGDPLRKQLFVNLENSKWRKIEKFKDECDVALDKFILQWDLYQTTDLYRQLFDEGLLLSLDPNCSEEVARGISSQHASPFGYDDLAALLYIEHRLNGIKGSYKYMVVDEAQDLGTFQIFMLKQFTSSMTIMGDITQSIYPSGLQDWDDVDTSVLGLSEPRRLSMDTSYRSTSEIINVANMVIKNSDLKLPGIIPASRKGFTPVIRKVINGTDLLNNITESLNEFKNKEYKKIAIIGKDLKQTEKIFTSLHDQGVQDLQFVDSDDTALSKSTIVISSYLVKGMEFDAVIIPNASDQRFTTSNLDAKLLYICITRAHHDLHIFYHGAHTKLLEGISQSNEIKQNDGLDELL